MNKETDFPFRQSAIDCEIDIRKLTNGELRIAIPSRGELVSGSLEYLSLNGFDTSLLSPDGRKLAIQLDQKTIAFKLRVKDMWKAFRNGVINAAIVGADEILEEQLEPNPAPIAPVQFLGFGGCSFRIGFPFDRPIPNGDNIRETLQTGRIATSLPNILKYIFAQEGLSLPDNRIITFTGSVEAAISLYRDRDIVGIADRVQTGGTMLANTIRPDLALIEFPGAYLVVRQTMTTNHDVALNELLPNYFH